MSTIPATRWVLVRLSLLVLAAFELTLGVWTTFFPENFYNEVPTVDWTPPYSEHLFSDFGGATLGLGVMLAAATIWMERRLVLVALVAYLAFAVPHSLFHLEHLHGDSVTWSRVLEGYSYVSVIWPLAVLALAWKPSVTSRRPSDRRP
ncbi:hypothetical protein GCM10009745_48450 [Kribbella yunnanensis]|uniref:DUF4345 domain-containing protein n=1 Tax=Kribbella yunnanensis TaxID=190194 RepID=A0ABP4U386_9ACTN